MNQSPTHTHAVSHKLTKSRQTTGDVASVTHFTAKTVSTSTARQTQEDLGYINRLRGGVMMIKRL